MFSKQLYMLQASRCFFYIVGDDKSIDESKAFPGKEMKGGLSWHKQRMATR
jgi:hypothetical protein